MLSIESRRLGEKNKCKMVTVVGSAKEMSLELWGVSHAGRSVSQASQRNWQFSRALEGLSGGSAVENPPSTQEAHGRSPG